MDWESVINRCTLLPLEWISNQILLGTISSHLRWSMIEDNVRKRMYICMYDWVTWLYSRKLTENSKPTIMENTKIIFLKKVFVGFFLVIFSLKQLEIPLQCSTLSKLHNHLVEVNNTQIVRDQQRPTIIYRIDKQGPTAYTGNYIQYSEKPQWKKNICISDTLCYRA